MDHHTLILEHFFCTPAHASIVLSVAFGVCFGAGEGEGDICVRITLYYKLRILLEHTIYNISILWCSTCLKLEDCPFYLVCKMVCALWGGGGGGEVLKADSTEQ